jgi:O-palmitoleoyl-L-serine hydrolase
MWYGDGASFSGYRADPWPVPGNASAKLWFRGARNLDASLDYLFSKYNIANTGLLIVTGGSAGGLSTFLHLDHIAARMAAAGSAAVVRGRPVCGFFLDALNDYGNITSSYHDRIQYIYNMQNSSGALSAACQATYGIDAYKCLFAPHAVRFGVTPWFAEQSRTDTWQLANIAQIPCALNALECNATEWGQIQAYAPQFMDQWLSVAGQPDSHNGGFLDACLIHGSTESTIDGMTNSQAFASWLEGSNTAHGNWWTMQCNGSSLTGPCDHGPTCGKFPGNATPSNP